MYPYYSSVRRLISFPIIAPPQIPFLWYKWRYPRLDRELTNRPDSECSHRLRPLKRSFGWITNTSGHGTRPTAFSHICIGPSLHTRSRVSNYALRKRLIYRLIHSAEEHVQLQRKLGALGTKLGHEMLQNGTYCAWVNWDYFTSSNWTRISSL